VENEAVEQELQRWRWTQWSWRQWWLKWMLAMVDMLYGVRVRTVGVLHVVCCFVLVSLWLRQRGRCLVEGEQSVVIWVSSHDVCVVSYPIYYTSLRQLCCELLAVPHV
jgi:hypothetical protein